MRFVMYTIDLTNKCNYCLRCTKEAKELFNNFKEYFNNTITNIDTSFLIKDISWLKTKGSHLLEKQYWVITCEIDGKELQVSVYTGLFHKKVSFSYSDTGAEFSVKVLFEKFKEYTNNL